MSKVSVIVPVYNAEKYLKKCITSIVNQTMSDIEILVIDDGSTDESLAILEQLRHEHMDKIRLFPRFNGGAGAARNVGLDHATGEYIKFVDADDYLKFDILETMCRIAEENKVSLVRGNLTTRIGPLSIKDAGGFSDIKISRIVDITKEKDYFVTEMPGIGNKLFRRDLIGDLRFPEKTKWEDLAVVPILLASAGTIYHMNTSVYNYRISTSSTTIKDFIKSISNVLDIVKCLEIVKSEMKARGLSEEFSEQITKLYILHTLFRVENAMKWAGFPEEKKRIVISSFAAILDTNCPNWEENEIISQYKEANIIFRHHMKKLNKFMLDEYRSVDIERAKQNIKRIV